MGTRVEAWLDEAGDPAELESWFEEVEARCSRFRPDSELCRINDDPHEVVAVSLMMEQILMAADRARRSTGGLVDVGVGSAVIGWGYDRTFEELVGLGEAPGPFLRDTWHIEPGVIRRSPGTRIDLGGIAKGWACDRAVEFGLATVVSAGGDIRSADPATTAMILDPWGELAAHVHVGEGALATSSVSKRRWQVGEVEANHLIDPRTMRPVVGPVLSASAVAGTAVEAEVAAKSVLLSGVDGLAWAESQEWVGSAVVVWHDGSVFATVGTEVAA